MSQKFTIPGRLMGRNEHDYLNRSHWSKGRKAKKQEEEKVILAIKAAKLKPISGSVEIGINYIEGKKKNHRVRDIDNIIGGGDKVILDALVKANIIKDDNPYTVKNVYHWFKFNAQKPRIDVEIMPYKCTGRCVFYPPIAGLGVRDENHE